MIINKVSVKRSKAEFQSITIACTQGDGIVSESIVCHEEPVAELQQALDGMLPYAVAIAYLDESEWMDHGTISGVTIKHADGEITGYCVTAQHRNEAGQVQCVSTRFLSYEDMSQEEFSALDAIAKACTDYLAGIRKISQLTLF